MKNCLPLLTSRYWIMVDSHISYKNWLQITVHQAIFTSDKNGEQLFFFYVFNLGFTSCKTEQRKNYRKHLICPNFYDNPKGSRNASASEST